MGAMKSMKSAAMKGSGLTQSAVYSSVAETVGLKPKQVKGVVEGIMGVASEQLKKNGAFKFAGMLNMKLKKKPATSPQGRQPFHQGAVRLQGQARLQDRACVGDEEVEGSNQLSLSR